MPEVLTAQALLKKRYSKVRYDTTAAVLDLGLVLDAILSATAPFSETKHKEVLKVLTLRTSLYI